MQKDLGDKVIDIAAPTAGCGCALLGTAFWIALAVLAFAALFKFVMG
jgi:hypothetical protein